MIYSYISSVMWLHILSEQTSATFSLRFRIVQHRAEVEHFLQRPTAILNVSLSFFRDYTSTVSPLSHPDKHICYILAIKH